MRILMNNAKSSVSGPQPKVTAEMVMDEVFTMVDRFDVKEAQPFITVYVRHLIRGRNKEADSVLKELGDYRRAGDTEVVRYINVLNRSKIAYRTCYYRCCDAAA